MRALCAAAPICGAQTLAVADACALKVPTLSAAEVGAARYAARRVLRLRAGAACSVRGRGDLWPAY
jgi:hypothetical protein